MFKKIISRIHRGNVLPLALFLILISGGVGVKWQMHLIDSENLHSSASFNVNHFMESETITDIFYNQYNEFILNQGEAIIKNDTSTKLSAKENSSIKLKEGDQIIMSENSKATIQWFEGSVSRLDGKNDLIIQKAEYDHLNPANTQIAFFVFEGKIWNKVNRLIDPESEFKIESNESIAGVRGSIFNYELTPGKSPTVDCIEHAIYIKPKDNTETDILVSGQKAVISKEQIEISNISKEDYENDWYNQNSDLDQTQSERNKQKYLNNLRVFVGPLPNEPGYEAKMELMMNYIESIENTEGKKIAESKMGRMLFYEALLLAEKQMEAPTTNELTISMNRSAKIWQMESDLYDASFAPAISSKKKEEKNEQMKNELKLLEKAMSDILPDDKGLYEAKEVIRQKYIELEPIPDRQSFMKERLLENKLFEIIDLNRQSSSNSELIEDQIRKYENEINLIQPNLQNSRLKEIHNKAINNLPTQAQNSNGGDRLKTIFSEDTASSESGPAENKEKTKGNSGNNNQNNNKSNNSVEKRVSDITNDPADQ